MNPKDYFFKNFKNAIVNHNLDEIADAEFKMLFFAFKDMCSDEEYAEIMRTDFPYSNDPCINKNIVFLKKESRYHIIDSIYVGKLENPMPNCYTVNSDEIDGCLICYTTGMSENTDLFAQTLVSIFMGESLGVNKDVVNLYTSLLIVELERRIHDWYGKKIASNIAIDMAMNLLKEDKIYNILSESSQYSILMDTVLILHEYAHYVLRIWTHCTNTGIFVLVLKAIDIYISLCMDNPEVRELPEQEIQADLMALLILTNGYEFESMGIICILAAFLQLNNMSTEDKYTNEHRLKVIRYFFIKYSMTYQQDKRFIEHSIEVLLEIFERTRSESFDMKAEFNKGTRIFRKIFKASSLPFKKKEQIYRYGIDYLNHLENTLQEMEKNDADTDPSDFEDF